MNNKLKVQHLTLNDVLPVRQQVLWPKESIEFCRVENDETAKHYGVLLNDTVVAVASIYIDKQSARLRKFATLPQHQRQGIGTMLIKSILKSLRDMQIACFWCDARESAAGFYQRFGMTVCSERFYKQEIAYVKMTCHLT